MNRHVLIQLLVPTAIFVAACTGATDTELDDPGVSNAAEPTDPSASGEGEDPGTTEPQKTTGTGTSSGGSSSGSTGGGCKYRDNTDHDGDGLSWMAGDCNDCDANVRPGKIDSAGDGIDQDCSGAADDDATCDASLALASTDPMDAARALGVCHTTTAAKPNAGVIDVHYVKPDGTSLGDALSYGILGDFGTNNRPTLGKAMLALSTGTARAPNQPGYKSPSGYSKGYSHGTPEGWPKPSPGCSDDVVPSSTAKDGAALALTVKVPIDAHSMSFEHSLFTFDYSADVCTQYADNFVVIMDPPPAGAIDGNIVFDNLGGPVNVNSPFLQACTSGTFNGITFACGQGTSPLAGTGFEGHGGTGWLRTTVPVAPGSTIKLLFAVWDSGDGTYDTTVLLDSLRFWAGSVTKVQTVAK